MRRGREMEQGERRGGKGKMLLCHFCKFHAPFIQKTRGMQVGMTANNLLDHSTYLSGRLRGQQLSIVTNRQLCGDRPEKERQSKYLKPQ